MNTEVTKEALLSNAQLLLDDAEKLIDCCSELEKENAELKATRQSATTQIGATWIEFDETDSDKRPLYGELVVVQVGNCLPYMLTYLKGCKVNINKWFRLPE